MRVAVITPYYKENIETIFDCHSSVIHQTYKNIRHFIISDGYPNPEIDKWDCEHIKIPPCADYGDSPRGIGAAIASAQGYDAICFLDADCWYDKNHVEEMVFAVNNSSAQVATCARNLFRIDKTFMRVDDESDGQKFNDTNCYFFTKEAFFALRSWLFKDKKQATIGDRILWKTLADNKVKVARSLQATLNYITTFAIHYMTAGEIPPPNSKMFIEANSVKKLINYDEYQKILQSQMVKRTMCKDPISVVCWLWNDDKAAYTYNPEYVNKLNSMLKRNTSVPFNLVCVTDEDATLFESDIRVIKTPESARKLQELRTPEGKNYPTCYRRLWMFSEEAKILGDKVLLIDIDTLIVGNVDNLLNIDEDFVGWHHSSNAGWGDNYFIGCLWLHKTGTRTSVWEDFVNDPERSIKQAKDAGYRGSDQAWISYKLFASEKKFEKTLGLYTSEFMNNPPQDAKIIQFNGFTKPWTSPLPIVKEHWK